MSAGLIVVLLFAQILQSPPSPNHRIPFCSAQECANWHHLCFESDVRAAKDGTFFVSNQELLSRDTDKFGDCGRIKGYTWKDVLRLSQEPKSHFWKDTAKTLPATPNLADAPINHRVSDVTDPNGPIYCDKETPEGFWGHATPGHLIRLDTSIDIRKLPEESLHTP